MNLKDGPVLTVIRQKPQYLNPPPMAALEEKIKMENMGHINGNEQADKMVLINHESFDQ